MDIENYINRITDALNDLQSYAEEQISLQSYAEEQISDVEEQLDLLQIMYRRAIHRQRNGDSRDRARLSVQGVARPGTVLYENRHKYTEQVITDIYD